MKIRFLKRIFHPNKKEKNTFTINIKGDFYDDKEFIEMLAKKINEAVIKDELV